MNLFRREGRRKRLPVVAFAGVLFAFQAIALVGAQTASAAFTSCNFSGSAITVQLGINDTVVISADATDAITLDGLDTVANACTGSATRATLANTTSITVQGNTGNETLSIDLSIDWGTIKWVFNGASGTGDVLDLDGSGITTVNGFTKADALDLVVGASGVDLTNDGTVDATVSGVEEVDVEGGEFDDTISGGGGTAAGGPTTIDMVVSGGPGDDWFVSGAGNDTFNGDAGIDDTIDFSASTAAIFGTVNGLFSGMGSDTTTTMEDVYGSPQGDTFFGAAGLYSIFTPAAGDDKVTCNAVGGGEIDFSDSAAGVTVDVDAGTATGDGTDTFSNCEDVSGSDLDDTITGDIEVNALYGNAGNDSIDGADAADIIDGGGGTDWVDYSLRTDAVTVNLTKGTVPAPAGPTAGSCNDPVEFTSGNADDVTGPNSGDCLNAIENAALTTEDDTFIGSAFNNTVEPNGGANSLTGGGGADTVDYSVGYDAGVTVNLAGGGGAGTDAFTDLSFVNVIGTSFADNITGNELSNTLKSRKGSDNVRGGSGDDTIKAGAGNDLVRAGTGDDDLWGQKGNDNLNGGKGSDFCKGGPGKDKLKSCESGHK